MADKQVTVVVRNRVADRWLAWYESSEGEVVRVEITKEQYEALALPKPKELGPDAPHEPQPRPQLPKGEWRWTHAAGECVTLDTHDGDLHEGDFYPGDAKTQPILCEVEGWLTVFDKNEIVLDASLLTVKGKG